MKNLDMLAKACEPAPATPGPVPGDLSKITDDIVDKIAARVISKLSEVAADPEPTPDPDPEPEGGAADGSQPEEPGPVD